MHKRRRRRQKQQQHHQQHLWHSFRIFEIQNTEQESVVFSKQMPLSTPKKFQKLNSVIIHHHKGWRGAETTQKWFTFAFIS
jgi:hypothetical protein